MLTLYKHFSKIFLEFLEHGNIFSLSRTFFKTAQQIFILCYHLSKLMVFNFLSRFKFGNISITTHVATRAVQQLLPSGDTSYCLAVGGTWSGNRNSHPSGPNVGDERPLTSASCPTQPARAGAPTLSAGYRCLRPLGPLPASIPPPPAPFLLPCCVSFWLPYSTTGHQEAAAKHDTTSSVALPGDSTVVTSRFTECIGKSFPKRRAENLFVLYVNKDLN